MNGPMPKLLTLEDWLAITYGENAPSVLTARRWIREGKVYPKPEKHGRSYYLVPDARYVDPANPPQDLKPSGRPSPLLKKAALA